MVGILDGALVCVDVCFIVGVLVSDVGPVVGLDVNRELADTVGDTVSTGFFVGSEVTWLLEEGITVVTAIEGAIVTNGAETVGALVGTAVVATVGLFVTTTAEGASVACKLLKGVDGL